MKLEIGLEYLDLKLGYLNRVGDIAGKVYGRLRDNPKETAVLALSAAAYLALSSTPATEPLAKITKEAAWLGIWFNVGRLSK